MNAVEQIRESRSERLKNNIKKYITDKGGTLKSYYVIDAEHQLCYWYGGEVVYFVYKGYTFQIDAIGDVRAWLFERDEDDFDGVIAEVRDKGNFGVFYDEMRAYLRNDDELIQANNDERLIFDNNNWFEGSVTDPNGYWHDLTWCLDADTIEDAVIEVLAAVDEVIADIEADNA